MKPLIIFKKKKIEFFGSYDDLKEYQQQKGNAFILEQSLDKLISSFKDLCEKNNKDILYMVDKAGDEYSIMLLWNEKNKYKLYMMIYDRKNDTRLYSVGINKLSNLYNKERVDALIEALPDICNFNTGILQRQKSADIWKLNDLQKFADAVDKLFPDYNDS